MGRQLKRQFTSMSFNNNKCDNSKYKNPYAELYSFQTVNFGQKKILSSGKIISCLPKVVAMLPKGRIVLNVSDTILNHFLARHMLRVTNVACVRFKHAICIFVMLYEVTRIWPHPTVCGPSRLITGQNKSWIVHKVTPVSAWCPYKYILGT